VDKELKVLDRRAGRSSYKLDEIVRYINQHLHLGVRYTFMRIYGHRAVLIIKEKLSDKISSNDPLKTSEKVKPIRALNPQAERSAELVQEFVDKAFDLIEFHPVNGERISHGLPPANYLLTREAGNVLIDLMPHFNKKWKVKPICISEPGAVRAIFMLAGFNSIKIPELDFESKLNYIFENLNDSLAEYDFVAVHFKDTDEPGHDGDFERKKEIIERFDAWLGELKDFNGIIVITTDHITSTQKKSHMPGKVPVLVYGKGKDRVKTFNEISAKKGKLKNYSGRKLWRFVLK
jgi:2,3-bisphosphoglycerate-independent phosphoglycerate mutase